MSDLGEKLEGEVEALKRARDELRVQIQLGKAEARDLWDKTEHRWHEVESKLKLVSREAEEPLREAGSAAREVLHEIGEAYKRIRRAL